MILRNKKLIDVTNTWLLLKKLTVKESTFYKYKYIVDQYILVYFKNKRMYFFTHYDFNIYVEQLSKTLSTKTVNNILIIFKSILKYAARLYNINFRLDLICTLKNKKKNINILDKKDIQAVENYCLLNDDPKTLGVEISLLTGMRLGEICALKWKNIDLKVRCISVTKTLQRVYKEKGKTEIKIDDPKSITSIRKIPIPRKLAERLIEIKRQNHYKGNEYILTGSSSRYVEPRTLERCFDKCLKMCKIKHYNFHTLRHTFATNCINIGMDPKSLSVILGHADVKITLDRYVHPSIKVQRKYLDKL